ncbi:unnamed protein product [Chondrus crispus]|uniref:Uncharacterized protein n=1 Tax=Chondrus crispus TaxID=2769 RepID=R7QF38_CHOCR|nr:unnamed protein product [Chondrus crispus]CDF36709.1 unnamed protein product [Chondrus crispus]|eukprot:XP_005716528.1 unnamed protein product [Chondrus crispus]
MSVGEQSQPRFRFYHPLRLTLPQAHLTPSVIYPSLHYHLHTRLQLKH